jgi:hypothetical protein
MFPDPRFYYFRTLWHFLPAIHSLRHHRNQEAGPRRWVPGRVVGFHVAENDSHSVLEFPYEALVCRFRVADKEQHQNHSHKWDQPSYYHDRIEDVSRRRLPRVGKMPD